MFANFLHLFGRRQPDADYEHAFVREVNVAPKRVRNPGVERLIWTCWILIAFKSIFVWWACARYAVPMDPLWVILPTLAFAVLCTVVYYCRK